MTTVRKILESQPLLLSSQNTGYEGYSDWTITAIVYAKKSMLLDCESGHRQTWEGSIGRCDVIKVGEGNISMSNSMTSVSA